MTIKSKKLKRLTFDVAIVLGVVLGRWIEGYFQPFGHVSPLFWCRVMEEVGQILRKLEADQYKTLPSLMFVSRLTALLSVQT